MRAKARVRPRRPPPPSPPSRDVGVGELPAHDLQDDLPPLHGADPGGGEKDGVLGVDVRHVEVGVGEYARTVEALMTGLKPQYPE